MTLGLALPRHKFRHSPREPHDTVRPCYRLFPALDMASDWQLRELEAP